MIRVFFLSLLSRNFDDQLSSNFHRFVILCLCWYTASEKTGLWQLPIVSSVFKTTPLFFKNVLLAFAVVLCMTSKTVLLEQSDVSKEKFNAILFFESKEDWVLNQERGRLFLRKRRYRQGAASWSAELWQQEFHWYFNDGSNLINLCAILLHGKKLWLFSKRRERRRGLLLHFSSYLKAVLKTIKLESVVFHKMVQSPNILILEWSGL